MLTLWNRAATVSDTDVHVDDNFDPVLQVCYILYSRALCPAPFLMESPRYPTES